MTTLHITFSGSVAGILSQALAAAGRSDERVLAFPDALALGPVDPPDSEERCARLLQDFGYTAEDIGWLRAWLDEFWDRLLGAAARRTFWYSRRWTHDCCGMMEMVRRLGDAPYDAIEFTRSALAVLGPDGQLPPGPYLHFGEMNVKRLRSFLDHVQPVLEPEREAHRAVWARLMAENAPLRVLRDGTIQSAAIDAYDTELLALARPDWRETARIIGDFWVRNRDAPHSQADQLFLVHRIRTLAAQGRLETTGNLSDIRASAVRLAPARSP